MNKRKLFRFGKTTLASLLAIAIAVQAVPVSLFASADDEVDSRIEFRDAFDAINQDLQESEAKVLAERAENAKTAEVIVEKGSDEGYKLENGKKYIFKKNLEFINKNKNGNGMEVEAGATVFMQIEAGVTVTAQGGDATQLGAGAGIYVPESSTLVIMGEGKLIATGGNAYSGLEGETGWNALCDINARNKGGIFIGGKGGDGGFGGGGAGAGIGGYGGKGGDGGKGGTFADAVSTYTTSGLPLPLWGVKAPDGVKNDEGFGNLFNSDVKKKYCVNTKEKSLTIEFKTNGNRKIGSYSLFTANDTDTHPERNPSSWVLYGSTDTIVWKEISKVENPGMGAENFKEYKYEVPDAEAFRYYRFVFKTSDMMQLSYLKMNEVPVTLSCAYCNPSDEGDHNGYAGEDGKQGDYGARCGNVYIIEKVSVEAKSGLKAYQPGNGAEGGTANSKGADYHNYYIAGGGGGGGAGSAGLVAQFGIGAGGAGGSGGAGGGAGSTRWSSSNSFESKYPHGGNGGAAGKNGAEGQSSGSQKGGNGGNGGTVLGYDETTSNGKVYMSDDAKVSGRNDGDIERGSFIITDDGQIINAQENVVDSLENFVPKDKTIYIFNKNLSRTATGYGENGLTLPEKITVIFHIEPGVTIDIKGGPANDREGAGAGIYVPESTTLILKGSGKLNAIGGDAANGGNGTNGEDAYFEKAPRNNAGLIAAGNGGNGGCGGGGAGAGIGGKGGRGGEGGLGGIYGGKAGYSFYNDSDRITVSIAEGTSADNKSENYDKLIDNDTATKWCVTDIKDNKSYVIFDAKSPVLTRGYTLTTGNDTKAYPGRNPKSWKFYGSNDKKDWALLQSVDNPALKAENQREFAYSYNTKTSYRYYKLEFEANSELQFSEFRLFKAIKLAAPTESSGETADVMGTAGSDGSMGTRGTNCGKVYIMGSLTVNAVSGKSGKSGADGSSGAKANDKGSGYNNYYTAGRGAGGAGGAGGLAADYGIGGGGAGGTGGGGGGSGATRYSSTIDYNEEHANGGVGGTPGRSYGSVKGGNGGLGGIYGEKQLSGVNGEIYIDYASTNVDGRPYFIHKADLSVNMNGNITVRGYSDLITNFSGTATPLMLALALREVLNHGGNIKGTGYTIVTAEEATFNGDGSNEFFKGAYRNGSDWNKNLVDNSGGYLYLLSVVFGSYIKENISGDKDNPEDFVNATDTVLRLLYGPAYIINDETKRMMSELFYAEHYYDVSSDGSHGDRAYTYNHPTSDSYKSREAALNLINYSYTTVYDPETARYHTMSYDTLRRGVDYIAWFSDHFGYVIHAGSFASIDGYKGITLKNWMHFLPDDASVSQINIPGTHDTGTYNVKLNWDMVDKLVDAIPEIISDTLDKMTWKQYLIAIAAGTLAVNPAVQAILRPLLSAVLITAEIKFDGSTEKMIQYFVDGMAKCNDLTFAEQLNAGLRSFDIRLAYDRDGGKSVDGITDVFKKGEYGAGLLKLCHGTLEEFGYQKYAKGDVTIADGHNPDGSLLTLKNILDDCREFLKENKSESIYLFYKCEGSDNKDPNSEYSKALNAVLEMADKNKYDDLVIIRAGDKMPTVGEARRKVYLIYTKDAECVENEYSVDAAKKIELVKKAFAESELPSMRQNYTQSYLLNGKGHPDEYNPRMVYTSTYDLDFSYLALVSAKEYLSGTPMQMALGDNGVNQMLDSYMFKRGQYYGWVHMNFPTQGATSNIIFSNVLNVKKDNQNPRDLDGAVFADFNIFVLIGAVVILLIPAIAIPVARKKKKQKASQNK